MITPGLVDIHTHGALGHTFNEAHDRGVHNHAPMRTPGAASTSLVATLATGADPRPGAGLNFVASGCASRNQGAQVLGMHLESPYHQPGERARSTPGQHVAPPDDGTPDILLFF